MNIPRAPSAYRNCPLWRSKSASSTLSPERKVFSSTCAVIRLRYLVLTMVLAPRAVGELTVISTITQGAPSSWMTRPFLKSDVVNIFNSFKIKNLEIRFSQSSRRRSNRSKNLVKLGCTQINADKHQALGNQFLWDVRTE